MIAWTPKVKIRQSPNVRIGFDAAVCSYWGSETRAAGLLHGEGHHNEMLI